MRPETTVTTNPKKVTSLVRNPGCKSDFEGAFSLVPCGLRRSLSVGGLERFRVDRVL